MKTNRERNGLTMSGSRTFKEFLKEEWFMSAPWNYKTVEIFRNPDRAEAWKCGEYVTGVLWKGNIYVAKRIYGEGSAVESFNHLDMLAELKARPIKDNINFIIHTKENKAEMSWAYTPWMNHKEAIEELKTNKNFKKLGITTIHDSDFPAKYP